MPRISASPEIILAEGPSKTMKTTIANVAMSALEEQGLRVFAKDAGSFFRIVTKVTLDELVMRGIDTPTEADLDLASHAVLQTEVPFDVERKWEGLHEPHIDEVVGKVSRANHVQAAGKRWWNVTADRAVGAGADALILDGRNPRDRLMPWLTENQSGVALELFCECDPRIAAERTLRGNGIADPTESEIAGMKQSILARRHVDSTRESLPYRTPTTFVEYHSGFTAEELVQQARSEGKPEFPVPIRLDTGTFEREPMGKVVGSLVIAATSLVQ